MANPENRMRLSSRLIRGAVNPRSSSRNRTRTKISYEFILRRVEKGGGRVEAAVLIK